MQRTILLDSTDKVQQFVRISQKSPISMDLLCKNHTSIDAKSIMGVLSCCYGIPTTLDIHADEKEADELMSQLKKYFIS